MNYIVTRAFLYAEKTFNVGDILPHDLAVQLEAEASALLRNLVKVVEQNVVNVVASEVENVITKVKAAPKKPSED